MFTLDKEPDLRNQNCDYCLRQRTSSENGITVCLYQVLDKEPDLRLLRETLRTSGKGITMFCIRQGTRIMITV